MMNSEKSSKPGLFIIGASGHGKVVAEIARLNNYDEIVFLDDNDAIKECAGYPVVGKTDNPDIVTGHAFVAVGNAHIREKLFKQFEGKHMPVLIHPSAVIANRVLIEEGTVVMAGAVINTDTRIGRGCIINTSSSVDHDCRLEDFTHIAVGAHLCGTVNVGKRTWIGAGSIVSNNVDICENCMIGAGTVVIKNLDKEGTYVGVPARRL